jgi:hypothetical protein
MGPDPGETLGLGPGRLIFGSSHRNHPSHSPTAWINEDAMNSHKEWVDRPALSPFVTSRIGDPGSNMTCIVWILGVKQA